jgi:hypothetical protein
MTRRLPSLLRLLAVSSSPPSSARAGCGTMETLRLLIACPSRSLGSLRGTVVALRPFAPCGPQRSTEGREFVVRHPHSRLVPTEATRSPEFLWNPDVCTPCSSTPAGPPAPGQYGAPGMAPAGGNYVGSRNYQGFRSSIAWLYTLAVYASYPPSPTSTQDSLPAVGHTLPGGVVTHWVPLKGFCDASYIPILLSQVKLGAMPLLGIENVCH